MKFPTMLITQLTCFLFTVAIAGHLIGSIASVSNLYESRERLSKKQVAGPRVCAALFCYGKGTRCDGEIALSFRALKETNPDMPTILVTDRAESLARPNVDAVVSVQPPPLESWLPRLDFILNTTQQAHSHLECDVVVSLDSHVRHSEQTHMTASSACLDPKIINHASHCAETGNSVPRRQLWAPHRQHI